jgi:hypothetical protein
VLVQVVHDEQDVARDDQFIPIDIQTLDRILPGRPQPDVDRQQVVGHELDRGSFRLGMKVAVAGGGRSLPGRHQGSAGRQVDGQHVLAGKECAEAVVAAPFAESLSLHRATGNAFGPGQGDSQVGHFGVLRIEHSVAVAVKPGGIADQ